MQLKSLFFTYVECQMFEVYHIRTVQMYNNKHETYLKTHSGSVSVKHHQSGSILKTKLNTQHSVF